MTNKYKGRQSTSYAPIGFQKVFQVGLQVASAPTDHDEGDGMAFLDSVKGSTWDAEIGGGL